MGIRFKCHECEHRLNIKEFLAGKRGTCPKCGVKFRIPKSDQEYAIPLVKVHAGTAPEDEQAQSGPVHDDPDDDDVADEVPESESSSPASPSAPSETSPAGSLLTDNNVVWYVRPPSGGQYGPADSELMRQWLGENRVTAGSLVWREGWPQWKNAEEVFPEYLEQPVFSEVATESPKIDVSPAIDDSDLPPVSGSAEPTRAAKDESVGTRRRSKRNKRTTMITLLAVTSVVLIGVLILVVSMTGSPDATTQ